MLLVGFIQSDLAGHDLAQLVEFDTNDGLPDGCQHPHNVFYGPAAPTHPSFHQTACHPHIATATKE
jgi:hypothetical protein